MAYTPARGDTRISGAVGGTAAESRSVASVSPVKKLLSSPSTTVQRPRFSRPPVPPANTRSPVPTASSSSPQSSGASPRKNSEGNPVADAITTVSKAFASSVSDPLPTGVPGINTSNIPANTNFFSGFTDAIGFTSPPAASDFNASLGGLNKGGFVRRKS